jgi:hypothetical protein
LVSGYPKRRGKGPQWISGTDFFVAWWSGVFAGGFAKSAAQNVVFWWCVCGELRGEGGGLAACFSALKKVTGSGSIFCAAENVDFGP